MILCVNDIEIPDEWKYPSNFDYNDNSPAI